MNDNIINQIGTLTDLISELSSNNIYRFKTIDDIITFRSNYNNEILNYKSDQENILKNEILNLKAELSNKTTDYNNLVKTRETSLIDKHNYYNDYLKSQHNNVNLFTRLYHFLKRRFYLHKHKQITNILENSLAKPFINKNRYIDKLSTKITNIEETFDSIISKEVRIYENRINRTLNILDNLNPLIIGAIGEQKALNELSKLSNDYYIINNLKMNFNPPIYNRKEDDRICSIQVDHVVIGPTGIFIIETKNWSSKSIASLDLFSPIKQIRRTSFALFCYLNDFIRKGYLNSFSSHWGEYKISIKSLLLMINASTREQFQYVKVTDLQHLITDITRKDTVFNQKQIKEILRSLIN